MRLLLTPDVVAFLVRHEMHCTDDDRLVQVMSRTSGFAIRSPSVSLNLLVRLAIRRHECVELHHWENRARMCSAMPINRAHGHRPVPIHICDRERLFGKCPLLDVPVLHNGALDKTLVFKRRFARADCGTQCRVCDNGGTYTRCPGSAGSAGFGPANCRSMNAVVN